MAHDKNLVEPFAPMTQPSFVGHVERALLVSTIKVDFGLPINIEDMIDSLDEDGSGEIEWPEFKQLFESSHTQKQIF